jgi:hypothetical protein
MRPTVAAGYIAINGGAVFLWGRSQVQANDSFGGNSGQMGYYGVKGPKRRRVQLGTDQICRLVYPNLNMEYSA